MQDFDLTGLADQVLTLVSHWGLKVLGAIAVLLLGRLAAGWVRRAIRRALGRAQVDPTLVPFLSGLAYALMLAFVILAVLGLFGIPTTSVIAVLGAASLAVGLALQGTLSNFASGVMLLIFRPFRVGDFVEVGGTKGAVQEINIFSSVLHTPDNVRIIVPNSEIYGKPITNFTANETRRLDLVIGVAYDDDLQVASDTILETIRAHAKVLADPEPVVAVDSLGDSSVNFVVRPWVRTEDYWTTKWDLVRGIKERLEAAGCSIPYPQRDVHLDWNGPGEPPGTVESGQSA
jgi:small conductance mechanosensitive channel